jgi:hypothetical protein
MLFVPWAVLVALAVHLVVPAYATWAWVLPILATSIVVLGYSVNLKRAPSHLPRAKGGEASASEAAVGPQTANAPQEEPID